MKTILEKVRKWLAAFLSEMPAFCELCKVVVRLIAKSVKKQDASADKSAFAELCAKTKNAQVAFEIAFIADKAMDKLNRRLTDLVFLTIQNDRGLMPEFMDAVGKFGWETVNQNIGRRVESRYNLERNGKKRNDMPESILAFSYSELKFK